MVNVFGEWKVEKDYSVFPEDEWCDYDYVAAWIISVDYKPKTTMENLVKMIVVHYDLWREEHDGKFYTDIKKSENCDGWMISTKDVSCFVEENGRLASFDYYC